MLNRRDFIQLTPTTREVNEGYWLHLSRPAMACRFEVTMPGRLEANVSAARDALDEVDRIEQQLTIFRDTSEGSFINRTASCAAVSVEKRLFRLLLLCRNIYIETNGAFDITSGALTRCWGFLQRQGCVPNPAELTLARSSTGFDKLLLDEQSRTVRFSVEGLELNFGSIGKGYALDRVAPLLGNQVHSALLSAGSSSMLALGRGDLGDPGWLVGLRHPRRTDQRMARLRLRGCALSTSGSEEQCFEYRGERYGHIIDPRSGCPARGVTTVTVVGPSATLTDALATAFYVGGAELARDYCNRHPGTVVVMLQADSEMPEVFGENRHCEVDIIRV
jgi:FAD:protein FMN transferase